MHTIHIHDTSYPIPSQWDELSKVQIRQIAWLTTLRREGAALSKLFFFILTSSLPFWKRLRLRWFYLIQATTEERGDFLLLVDSFKENRRFTAQIQEKIRVRSVLLQGPASGLANCTFFEFIQAEQYFINYLSKQEPVWLDKLVATLYRQIDRRKNPNADPDIRIPLNDTGIRFRAGLLSHASPELKLSILMWFDGCRQSIITRFPNIFPQPKASETTAKEKSKQPNSASSWLSLISELSTSMTEYERIGNTNLFTALTDISFRIKKSQDAKREAASRARKKR